MLRKIIVVGLTVAVAIVVFGCSNDGVTPEGQGTADSRVDKYIIGYCYRGSPPPGLYYPAEGVRVWCNDGEDYTDANGRYVLDVTTSSPPEYMWIYAQIGNLTPYPSEWFYYPGGIVDGPDFWFPL